MIPMSNRNYRGNPYVDRANQGYASDAESGIVAEAYSRPPSSLQLNQQVSTNQMPNVLNTSGFSCELYNTNAPRLCTRYDRKSQSSVSLYGSRKSLPVNAVVDQKPLQLSKKARFKKYIMKKIFSEDDSYAEGEYEKSNGANEISLHKSEPHDKEARENWSGKCDFFLSCLGYAVGLGAVWRFPYLCYKNGGGVFLIPYFIFLFFVGIPLFFLELSLGQYTSQGAISCWKMAPIFKGLGISMNFASALLCIYYNMIIAYSIYFLVMSFRGTLDWAKCDDAWASLNCTDDFTNFLVRCDTPDVVRDTNGVCYNYTTQGRVPVGWWNLQKRVEFRKPVLPSEEYFNNFILQKSTTIDNGSAVVWQLVLCLLAAWVITFLCIFKGIKASGKIVYFTAIFPYIVLLILGIYGWTLNGAAKGIEYYVKPDFSKLADANVWFDAAVQIFFTMSTSYGGLITLASYNKFNRNVFRDTFLITISNSMTAIFAGFVIFAYIGYLAQVTQQNVEDVVSSGPGLTFIIFPFAVTKLAGSPFWSILFFLMMLTLGLDSEFATLETIITSILDIFPQLKPKKLIIISVLCSSMFLLGLPYCTRAGQYWIEIMDKFSGGWSILIIGTLECICIGWIYGYNNFRKDIGIMIGKQYTGIKFFWYWIAAWCAISPLLLISLVIFSFIKFKPLSIDNYIFPTWANVIGWLITAFVLSGIVFWIWYSFFDALFINPRSILTLFKPEADWGPYKSEHKRLAVHLPNLAQYHNYSTNTPRDV